VMIPGATDGAAVDVVCAANADGVGTEAARAEDVAERETVVESS
jgi:hypothetical protein